MKNDDEMYMKPVAYFERPAPKVKVPASAQNSGADESPFAEPTPYFARNDDELSALRAHATKLEAELNGLEANNAPWVQRQRVRSELDAVVGRVRAAEFERDQRRQRETGIGRDDVPPPANNAVAGTIAGWRDASAGVERVLATWARNRRASA